MKSPPDHLRTNTDYLKLICCQSTSYWCESVYDVYNPWLSRLAFSCEKQSGGWLCAADFCCLLTKSFTQLLVSRRPESLALPLLVCGLGQSLAVCWKSEHSAEWSDGEKWKKRKWSTQEPLSGATVWEPLEVGGVRRKLCLTHDRGRQRVGAQLRHLVEQTRITGQTGAGGVVDCSDQVTENRGHRGVLLKLMD